MTTQAYKQLIMDGIEGLPDETLAEISDFIYFIRQKALQPDTFIDTRYTVMTGKELKRLDEEEALHLEQEFEGYEQRYPRE